MATRNIIESDLSGEPEASTVLLGFNKTWFEVDLTSDEQNELQHLLKPYLHSGRKVGSTPTKKKVVPETTVEEREEIRAWAKENGYELAEFGRIPKKIFAAYNEAYTEDAVA